MLFEIVINIFLVFPQPQKIYDGFALKLSKEAKSYLDKKTVKTSKVQRKLEKMADFSTSVLSDKDQDIFNRAVNDMTKVYKTAKVPDSKTRKQLSLEPEITKLMAESRNPEELEYLWNQHRETTGEKMRENFKQYLDLTNKAAR